MNTFKNSYLNFAFADNKTEEFRLRFLVKFLILNGSGKSRREMSEINNQGKR